MKLSLQIKVIFLVILSTVLLASGTIVVSTNAYADTMDKHYESMASNLTKTVSDVLDKDAVKELTDNVLTVFYSHCENNVPPDMTDYTEADYAAYYASFEPICETDSYKTVYAQLETIMQDNGVDDLYLCYMDLKTNSAVYLIDVNDPTPGSFDGIEDGNRELMEKGIYDFPAYITNYEEYGWLCTAASGIYAANGTDVIADAYVDIDMNDIMKDRAAFGKKLTLIVIVAAFIIAVITSIAVSFAITKPINSLSKAAGKFVTDKQAGDGESAISQVNIRTGDEIEKLSNAIKQMAADINSYITDLTQVTAEKERIGAELGVAAHIQLSMLPCIFPAFPDRKEFDIYATMTPAKEVGGDFYDFFMVDNRHLAIVVADVSGKGVPAALFMVIGKTLIKDHTQSGADLSTVFTTVNNLLCDANSEGMFITAFEGVLDLVTGEFAFVNAGHEMPCICKKDGTYVPYKTRAGFVLAGMENMKFTGGCTMLEPGDRIFQYTDGVTEATNANNELFGMTRMVESLNNHRNDKPQELLPALKADIDAFVGKAPQFDDITMLALEYKERMAEE